MIRALSFFWDPAPVWERIAQERKSLFSVFIGYFLPTALLVAIGEGYALAQWRTWTDGTHGVMHFSLNQIVVFEAMCWMVTLCIVMACAYIVWLLREPFYGRYNFAQALMLVLYSFCPLFLCQVLTGVPRVSLWLPWAAAVYLSLRIFYHGVRCLAKTDPGSVVGLYLLSSLVIIGLTGAQRFMLIQCLSGHGASINNFIFTAAAKLH